MFHVLADGTGGFLFMKKLIFNYCRMKYDIQVVPDADIQSSADEKKDDAFSHYYTKEKNRDQLNKMMSVKSYQIRQEKDDNIYETGS